MHFNFIDETTLLETAIQGIYDPVLVCLSLTVACVASYSAFILTRKVDTHTRNYQTGWLIAGAITQGMGIWAMHFIGMLAFSLPATITVNYDPWITAISIMPAILASFVVFKTTKNSSLLLINSILMGLGIGAMHYIGMSGMHLNAIMLYDPTLFMLSVLIAILLAHIALKLKLWAENSTHKLILFDYNFIIASIMMGLAVAAMHYTAMLATRYFPGPDIPINNSIISSEYLAWTIGIITIIIFASLLIATRISNRFETLEILNENDARLNSIINNTSDGIISINESGLIEIFNHGAEKIFGYQYNEVAGKDLSILLIPDERDEHKQYVAASALHAPRILNTNRDLLGQKKNGTTFPIEVNIAPIHYLGKNGYVGLIRDITERKQHEADLLEAMDLAEASAKAKMQFIAHMTHELRTPLHAILGFSQLMRLDQSEPPSEWQDNNLKEIEIAGNNLLSIIDNILDLSSIESQRIDLNIIAINIKELIAECASIIEPDLMKKNLSLETDLQKCADTFVHADYLRLKQVILNLLSNACQYNKIDGKVSISCEPSHDIYLRISITDTGTGVAEDKIKDLFEPFNRLGLEGGNIMGSGIGLNISMNLIELMDGYIGAESSLNHGSTFWIEIPIYHLNH